MMYNIFSLVLFFALLTGCSSFLARSSNDYNRSSSIDDTSVPDRFDRSALGQKYNIPTSSNSPIAATGFGGTPRPQVNYQGQTENFVKIQKLGSQTWILATLPTGEVWPRVNYFIQKLAIPTVNVDSNSGIIETDLVRFTNDPLFHQFIILLEQGVQLNTTEVTIFQRSYKERPVRIPLEWSLESTNPVREAWMREALANELALTINDNSISLLGEVIGSRSRVSIVSPIGKEPYLLLQLSDERAYGSVAYALQRDGFTIEAQSRVEGAFSVSYRAGGAKKKKGEVKKKSFFRRLFSFRRKEKIEFYNLQLSFSSGYTQVRIRDVNNYQLKRDLAVKLLTLIRYNLT